MNTLSVSSQCTQLTVHSRFAMMLTNYAHMQALEILINLCVTGSYQVHAFPAQFRPHGLHMIIFTKCAALSYIDFPPQQLPRIYIVILTTLAY